MGKHLQKLYSFRTNDELIKKIEYIAEKNTRNRNQQIEHILKLCVDEYELTNGKLHITEDGRVEKSIKGNVKPSTLDTG